MNQSGTVHEWGEFGTIRKIREILGSNSQEVILGIGDDAAVIQPRRQPLVITTDAVIEDIHFRRAWTSAEDLAVKAMASNLSDLAAKGAQPAYALVTLGIPTETAIAWVEDFYRALKAMRQTWGIEIIGGDTIRSPHIVVSITALGYQIPDAPLQQNTARVGDQILVTGTLGDAAAGLEILESGVSVETEDHSQQFLIRRFLQPTPRIRESRAMIRIGLPSAMTDISDGLARDLPKLCEAGNVSAKIDAAKFPSSEALKKYAGRRWREYAWKGGEDYELLLTLPPDACLQLQHEWNPILSPLTVIGEITEVGQGVVLENWAGEIPTGFDHFI